MDIFLSLGKGADSDVSTKACDISSEASVQKEGNIYHSHIMYIGVAQLPLLHIVISPIGYFVPWCIMCVCVYMYICWCMCI